MEYGELYIVPDENKFLVEIFHKKISNSHLMGIQEFSDCYKLGYHFKKEDYQEAPCLLAKDGFLVAKTVESAGILIFYVPEFISDNQCMWYSENMRTFSKYSTICVYVIRGSDKGYCIDEREDMDLSQLFKMMNQKNIMYYKNQSCKKR